MGDEAIRIFPLGDAALTVEFANEISESLNEKAIALAQHFAENPFPGFIESVPAYSSTTVFYDLPTVRRQFSAFETAFASVKKLVLAAIRERCETHSKAARLIDIPVHFDAGSAIDLGYLAQSSRLSVDEVIAIFTQKPYRVFMLGFLPGFTYMGEVDDRIATPRRETPRLAVPKGSVGIAGRQTGIYSLESPGGWQIIGRTDLEIFTPDAETPTLLQPGDTVRFFNADAG